MLRSIRQRKQGKGFTLLELVVVIVILAILAGLAVPRYIRTVNRSKSTGALTILDQLKGAAQRYYVRNNNVYTGMTTANLDFDPTDVVGVNCFAYSGGATAAQTYTFTATGNACGLVAADTITLTQAGIVTGAGAFDNL